jgi:hypothetical protein
VTVTKERYEEILKEVTEKLSIYTAIVNHHFSAAGDFSYANRMLYDIVQLLKEIGTQECTAFAATINAERKELNDRFLQICKQGRFLGRTN